MLVRNVICSALLALMLVVLTSAFALAADPGTNGRIAFVSDLSGTRQLYTINPDGTGLFQVTNLPPANDPVAFSLDYSPNSQQIVFSHDMTGALELYIINADGTGLKQITHDGTASAWPRWSPDGERIVYGRFTVLSPDFPDTGAVVITTIKIDGSDQQLLTSRVWDSIEPEYTVDGKHIVFSSSIGGLLSAIWIMDTNGKHLRQLTVAELEAAGPDVSPDGKHLVLYNHQNTSRPSSIFKMTLDGRGITRLTDTGHFDTLPVYSPDGNKILFMSDKLSPGSFDVWVMNADGSEKQRLIEHASAPNWGVQP
jgi:Tol biopolymer transport system component